VEFGFFHSLLRAVIPKGVSEPAFAQAGE